MSFKVFGCAYCPVTNTGTCSSVKRLTHVDGWVKGHSGSSAFVAQAVVSLECTGDTWGSIVSPTHRREATCIPDQAWLLHSTQYL